MSIISKMYIKSNNYNLSLEGIVPVRGYYQTTITCNRFIKGEKPEVTQVKITDKSFQTWKLEYISKNSERISKFKANYQLTLQGVKEVKNTESHTPPVLKLVGTKATPTKKAPVVTIVAPLNTTTAVIATEQNAEPAESGSSSNDDGDADPDHAAALARLITRLEYDLALSLEEELEEEEAEQEEQMDWAEDAEVENEFFEAQGLVYTSNTLTRLEFLYHVLPPTGMYCVVAIQKGKVNQTFPESIEEIDTWAEAQPALGNESYMSLATFEDQRRLARYAVDYKSVWIDLDCGKGTEFPDQIDAMVALKAFVDKVRLPKPTIVSSGYGLHVYFTFTEAAGYDIWHPIATALKARIRAESLQVNEAGLPTNSMRILRLPDTVNFKNNTEVDVKVLAQGIHATVEDYNRILNVFVEKEGDWIEDEEIVDCEDAEIDTAFDANDSDPEVQKLFIKPVVSNHNKVRDSLVSYLPKVNAPADFEITTLDEALAVIKSEMFKNIIESVRAAYKEYLVSGVKSDYTASKTNLPSFAFNGTFTGSIANANLLQSSNLFCGDIDGLGADEVDSTITKLIQEVPDLVSVFRSPSNHGLKFILVLPDGTVSCDADFKKVFRAVSLHFEQRLGVTIDKACRDVRRLCFVSYDPNIYINYDAVPFTYEPVADEAESKTETFGDTSTATNTYLETLAIDVASGLLRKAKAGERHGARVKVGRLVGGYVAGGWAREDVLVAAVMIVSDEISDGGHTNDVEIKTIHDGIAYGLREPISESMFKKEQGINVDFGFSNEHDGINTEEPDNYDPTFNAILDEEANYSTLDLLSYIDENHLLSRLAKQVAAQTHLPSSSVFITGLSVFSSVACRKYGIAYEDGSVLPIGLYTVVEQPSGAAKSRCVKAFEQPFHDIRARLSDAAKNALERFTLINGSKPAPDKLADFKVLKDTVLRLQKGVFISNATPEGLETTLTNTKGFYSPVSSEQGLIDSLLGVLYTQDNAKNNNDLILNGFDGGYVNSLRATREGYCGRVVGGMVCFAQQGSVETILGKSQGTGVAERFLMLAEPHNLGKRDHTIKAYVDPLLRAEYIKRCSLVEDVIANPITYEDLTILSINPKGFNLIAKYKNLIEPMLVDGGEYSHIALRGAASKADMKIMKIAANLHLLDYNGQTEIPNNHLISAIRLVDAFLKATLQLCEDKGITGLRAQFASILLLFEHKSSPRTERNIIQAKIQTAPFKEMTGNKSLAVKSALGQMVLQGLLLKTVSKGVVYYEQAQ